MEIKLRYLDLDPGSILLADAWDPEGMRRTKTKALARMGIVVGVGEKPLTAWLRVMAEENGLAISTPAHPELADAVASNSGACRFVFALA